MFSVRMWGRHLARSFVVGWRASSSVGEGSVSVSGWARVVGKGGKGRIDEQLRQRSSRASIQRSRTGGRTRMR